MEGPYGCNNEIGRGVEYNLVLYNYIGSEAQKFRQNGILMKAGSPPQITQAVLSSLDEMFLN